MKKYIVYTVLILFIGGLYATFQKHPNVAYTDEAAKSKDTQNVESNRIKCKTTEECEEALNQAVTYLKKTSKLLKEERTRWKRLHGKVKDKVDITKDDKRRKVYVEIELDSKVKNEINNQPITRTYTLDYSPASRPIFTYLDIMVGPAYAWKSGYRGIMSIGIRPFEFLKERNDGLAGLGIGVHTMVYNSGLILYYSHPTMAPMFFGMTVGWDWEGNTVPGVAIGLRI